MISRRTIVAAATIIMLGNVASRVLGIVREQVIAGLFGATGSTSAFVAASTVPTMIYDLLIGGALTAALIPVFSDYAERDKDDQLWPLVGTVMFFGVIALAIMAAVLTVAARPLVWILAPGLSIPDQEQTITLIRVVLPAVIFLGLSGITTAVLYSRQAFIFPAFCGAGFNLGIIVCGALFADVLGTTSLVVGIISGAVLQLALQIPGLRKVGFRFSLDFHHPALRRILLLYTPVAISLVVAEAGILIDRNLASQTGDESIAVMRFATTLVQLPVGLVAMTISYAVLPALSRFAGQMLPRSQALRTDEQNETDAQKESLHAFKSTLATGMRLTLLVMIPAAVGLVVLRTPIIQLLFQHGVFDAYATERTALAFLAYAPQLPFLPVDYLLVFAFYARKNTITPVAVGIFSVGIYVLVAMSLVGPLGMVGLCLANTAQNTLHAVVLFALLVRTMGNLRGYGLGSTVLKSTIASGVMGLVLLALIPHLESNLDMNILIARGLLVIVGIATGLAVYAAAVTLLRVEEATTLRQALRRRLTRSLEAVNEQRGPAARE